jgi:hypothetical protein
MTSSGPTICLPACLSAHISAVPTIRVFVKLDVGDFHENLSRKSKFGKNWSNKSGIQFYFCENISSPFKRCLRVVWCQAVRITEGP